MKLIENQVRVMLYQHELSEKKRKNVRFYTPCRCTCSVIPCDRIYLYIHVPGTIKHHNPNANDSLRWEIRMKKTLLCALFCLMGCFVFSACGIPSTPEPKNIMQPTQALLDGLDLLNPIGISKQEDRLGQESYFIVVDDGFGMKGFVSPYCQSYRTAITAISGVSMSSESACVRASDLVNEYPSAQSATKTFFQEAVNESFFLPKSNDAAAVIREMTEAYRNKPDQVMVLVSDLMIPTEDDCSQIAKALNEAVIAPEHATLGIIGILGDFKGTIENLPVSPTTGYKRKISEYMVKDKDANGNFKHPLYLMFFGDDQAVLDAMEKAMNSLEKSAMFDMTNDVKTLYLSEYDITRRDKDDIVTKFNLGYTDYNDKMYPAMFVFRGMSDKNGKIKYEAAAPVSETYQQALNSLPFAKLYTLERGTLEANVKIRCTVPYALIDSSVNGATIADSFDLLKPASEIKLKPKDYAIHAEIRVLDYAESQDGKAQASWVSVDEAMIGVASATIDESCKRVDVVLNVDTSMLNKDEPLLCEVFVSIAVKPKREAVEALYNTSWVDGWTLKLKEFDNESISLGQMETSARFTKATTERTPFLYNLIYYGLAEEQIKQVEAALSDQTAACEQTTMFGIIVRDVPIKYYGDYSWKPTENFGGWAFSEEDAAAIQSVIN